MRAVYFREHGELERLTFGELDTPKPGPKEVLVRVRACALNRLDISARKGIPGVHVALPHIPGSDVAGEVAEVGSCVEGLEPRQRVIINPGLSCGQCQACLSGWDSLCPKYDILGFRSNGGYAEFVTAPATNVIPVSEALSFVEWASIPLDFLTSWHVLTSHAALKYGEDILIHGAGSGVGTAAIQMAKYIGARVFTTSREDEKLRKAKELGADFIINYVREDFVSEIRRLTSGKGVEVVYEHIGPATWHKSIECLAPRGRLVTIGATTGPEVTLPLRLLYTRQLQIHGSYMGGKAELLEVLDLVERKALKPVVDSVFPLEEAREAQKRMIERKHFGKIVLEV